MDLSPDDKLLDGIDDLEYKFDEEYLVDEELQFAPPDEDLNPQTLLSATNEEVGDLDENDFSDSFDDGEMEELIDFDDDQDHGKLSQKDKVCRLLFF